MIIRSIPTPSDFPDQWEFSREDLRPDQLSVLTRYQRPLHFLRVREMAESWRPSLCMPLSVNLRFDGSYAVVDGQHRVAAAIQARVPSLECRVYYRLTYHQEAELFRMLNAASRQITPGEMFRAACEAQEETALAVQDICREFGFAIDYYATRSPRSIKCIHTALSLYRDLGTWRDAPGAPHPERLRAVLGVLAHIWHDQNQRTDGDILSAIDYLLTLYPPEALDRERLVTVLRDHSALEVLNRSSLGSVRGQHGRRLGGAAVMWKLYNAGLAARQRLPNKFPSRLAIDQL